MAATRRRIVSLGSQLRGAPCSGADSSATIAGSETTESMAELLARGFVAPDPQALRHHVAELHDLGFTIIPNVLSGEELEKLRSRFEAILADEGLRKGERLSFEST